MSIIYKGQTIDTAGKDATLNGVNNLTVKAGNGVGITQDGNTLTINATGGGSGGSDYQIAITFDSAFLGQPYTVTGPNDETYTGTVPESLVEVVDVNSGGAKYVVSSTDASGKQSSTTILTGATPGAYSGTLRPTNIYGVRWDGTATTKWSREGEASGFTDPVPYLAGATVYSSPFDNLMPWSGMVKSERAAGTMVAIPKFWYQLTQNTEGTPSSGMTIRIADGPVEGFSVSPAHMDRGDGYRERDVVYVGRYHCASDYKSKTGVLPKASMTRENFRTNIHALGSDIWQMDFATLFTIWLLYLVEFADWNSQSGIGYGCGNNSSIENMGYTDSMPYHTGTTRPSRDTYGLGTQYRYIEGLWDNVYDWMDGCYNNNNGLNIILNPNNFSDSSGGVSIGTPSNGSPSAFTVSNKAGFPMFYPTESNGGSNTYSCDQWLFDSSHPSVCVGGSYHHFEIAGLFFVNRYDDLLGYIGSRLMELPN